MRITPDDSRAPYLQVAAELRADIRSGALRPGDKIPSTRALADKYGVAPATAQNAVRVLKEEGLLFGQSGRGTFIRELPPDDEVAEDTPPQGAAGDELWSLNERVKKLEGFLRNQMERNRELEAHARRLEDQLADARRATASTAKDLAAFMKQFEGPHFLTDNKDVVVFFMNGERYDL